MTDYRLGIVGCGHMGEAILKGVLDSSFLNAGQIVFIEKNKSRKEHITGKYKISAAKDITELVKGSSYIFLAVKPQDLKSVLMEIKKSFSCKKNTIISIAAGVPTYYIEEILNLNASVIRIMPNAPALFGSGMAAVSSGRFTKNADLLFSEKLINSVGDYVYIDEKFQNIATALSGSGPAYFFLFCKYLIEAGIKNGLNEEISRKLIAGTMIGAGIAIEKSGEEMDRLIKKVASPGGTTEKALEEFDRSKLDEIITRAVESAKKRAYELQELLD
ncbi:MAG: pyrroline-5-carboxylate reductase [Actinomycetota bacterium]|nr:pyrroline-5-carboxylate reductase [Actinomycetota bacterium]